MTRAAPLRSLALLVGGWAVARAIVISSGGHVFGPADASVERPALREARAASSDVAPPLADAVPLEVAKRAHLPLDGPATGRPLGRERDRLAGIPMLLAAYVAAENAAGTTGERPIADGPASEAPLLSVDTKPLTARAKRWSGSAWLFARREGDGAIGPGGEIGGSQAGARVAYAVDDAGSIALVARGYAPLRHSGAEVSGGVEWHPLPRVPLRLAVERRRRVAAGGRSAWTASVAGGVFAEPLPGVLRVDGYAQAGVVGAKSRDLFADGSLRAGYPAPLGRRATATLGAGVWGAAQPGAKRLDVGPQAVVRVPLEQATLVLAVDYRLRAAGQARPTSGPALTLATDF